MTTPAARAPEKPNQEVIDKIKQLMTKQTRREKIKAEIVALESELTSIDAELAVYGMSKTASKDKGESAFAKLSEADLLKIDKLVGSEGASLKEVSKSGNWHHIGLMNFLNNHGYRVAKNKAKDNAAWISKK